MPESSGSFERAALAVVDGDGTALRGLLDAEPGLVRAHSRDHFGATLLHHVAANGIPDEFRRTPAVAIRVGSSGL